MYNYWHHFGAQMPSKACQAQKQCLVCCFVLFLYFPFNLQIIQLIHDCVYFAGI